MATLFVAALLGVIQGLTEFLPVSSSAHLILARAFFGWDADIFGLPFDVALHVGTLVAVLAYFRKDVIEMIVAAPGLITATSGPAKLARLIVIGTIPMVIIGVLFADWFEAHLRTPAVIAVTLVIGAVAMLAAERIGSQTRDASSLPPLDAVLTGLGQSTALVPGMSRSGSTIATAMLLGMTRASAARFSFLLGIPAIAAAAAKEGVHLLGTGLSPEQMMLFAVGMITSAAVGYVTIKFFLGFLAGHRLDVFAYYRLALAAVTVVWLWRA
ncbi:MAG: undecaprenyl-diphosphate phosphatase [Acidobacteriota bacterium]